MNDLEVPRPREPRPQAAGGNGKAVGTAALGIGFLLLKLKGGLGLLKLATFGKMLPTALSMGLMIWFEAQRWVWPSGSGSCC